MAHDKDYNKMIHSSRWVKLRCQKLTANPICERCWEENQLVTAATEVHHIHPVEDAVTYQEKERLMFSYANLRSLCHDCHVRTQTELGRSGKAATRKKNKEQVKSVINRYFE